MLHFVLIKHRSPDSTISALFEEGLDNRIPNRLKTTRSKWESKDKNTVVYYWINKNPNFGPDYYSAQAEGGLMLFNGWVNDGKSADCDLGCREKDFAHQDPAGEYMVLDLDANGEGSIIRSLTGSVQLYYSINRDRSVVSSRASLVSYFLHGDVGLQQAIDPKYLAWIISTSWALDDSTLFREVKILRQGASIRFMAQDATIQDSIADVWYDQRLVDLYSADRKRYWDECYERLVDNLNFFFDKFGAPFNFPLSGGRDSRLLFGLIRASKGRDLLERVVTNGPPYSGEVITARIVCNYLKLPHIYNDHNYVGASFDGKIGSHLFFTEAEVSPLDLCWNYTRVSAGMVLRGQESGLRNVSNVIDNDLSKIKSWFLTHFGNFNRMGILSDQWVREIREQFDGYLETERNRAVEVNNIPTKNRLENRFLRWGARIWSVHNTNEFSPFLYLDPDIVKHTYNAGAVSRLDEEFHFEMMSRADPDLVQIPFFKTPWPAQYNIRSKVVGSFYTDEKSMRGAHAIMNNNWESIRTYILRKQSQEFLGNMIDWKKLGQLNSKELGHSYYEPLWQVLQCSMLSGLRSFTEEAIASTVSDKSFPPLRDSVPVENDMTKHYKMKSEKYGDLLLESLAKESQQTPSESEIKTTRVVRLVKKLKLKVKGLLSLS